jgi:hypothetical protein
LGPAASATAALAVPVWADVMVSQLASLDAVQLQPVSVSRFAVRLPPPKPIEPLERVQAYRHGAADWLTSTVWPPTVIVADRADGTALAATL